VVGGLTPTFPDIEDAALGVTDAISLAWIETELSEARGITMGTSR
jgi:hypothetical protein